jgi:16S rRNA (cytosine967-C5)-methyltransferase
MVDPARQAAYETIAAVHRDDAYANLALPQILRELRLHGRDAAFATELTYGTLRWSGTLDAIIAVAADRDVARIDPPARDALRLGAYQLLHTRVAPHAAVASTVDLVRAVAGPGPTGFDNAVLRRIEATPLDGWIAEVAPDPEKDPLGYLAVKYAHPLWIVRAFAEALGGDETEVEALLAADNTPAPVHLCARPGRVERDALAEEVGGEPGRYSPFAVYLPGGAPGDLADAPLAGTDERWLDLCAGPGGKAALLGALAAQRGAHVTAVEVAPHRAALVEQAVRGLPVTVQMGDGREIEETGFDRVLVDAPCTGLGALRRRPEARWRRQPSDLPPLTRLQRELLTAAIAAARPGGLIGYVTCSPHVVETRVTVDEAIRRSPYTVEKVAERQLWPHREGTDAMYLALLRRAL